MTVTSVPHILVVDDDDRLRRLIARYLGENEFQVSAAADAKEARRLMEYFLFDLIILDVMMPGESGIDFARSYQNTTVPPILVLSALTEAEDRITGLEVGADDYLTKPFEPKELVLRIRAILRRVTQQAMSEQKLTFGSYCYHMDSGILEGPEGVVHLTSNEAALLSILAENNGTSMSRDKLASLLGLAEGSERTVDVQINRLRKKIEPQEGRPQHIQTLRGEGYVLQGSVL